MDKNTTVVFPAPLMSTIEELGSFLAREQAAALARPGVQVPAMLLPSGASTTPASRVDAAPAGV